MPNKNETRGRPRTSTMVYTGLGIDRDLMKALKRLARKKKVSRNALIGQAIKELVEKEQKGGKE